MRKSLTLPIFLFARLFLVYALIFNASLFPLFAQHLKVDSIEDSDSPLAIIQGRVWVDSNENGDLDVEDTGLANALVKLYTQAGTSQSLLTDEQGLFEFSNVATGTYDLEFINPRDYHFTAGSNSDVDRETGRIENIEINDSSSTVNGLLVGAVYQPQNRTDTSIGLDLFEVSPNVLDGSPAVFIEWETSREQGTEGFYILRSSTGSRDQASEISSLILSQGEANSADVNRYEYWDTNTQQGTIYSYWLQEKEIGGGIAEYGPEFTDGLGPGNGDHTPPVTGVDKPDQDNHIYLPLIIR